MGYSSQKLWQFEAKPASYSKLAFCGPPSPVDLMLPRNLYNMFWRDIVSESKDVCHMWRCLSDGLCGKSKTVMTCDNIF